MDAAARAMALPPGPTLRVFLRLAERWGLERSETMALLGIRSRTTFTRWRDDPDGASLDLVTRERIGHVFGIQAACVTLFGEGSAALWTPRFGPAPVRAPNRAGGEFLAHPAGFAEVPLLRSRDAPGIAAPEVGSHCNPGPGPDRAASPGHGDENECDYPID